MVARGAADLALLGDISWGARSLWPDAMSASREMPLPAPVLPVHKEVCRLQRHSHSLFLVGPRFHQTRDLFLGHAPRWDPHGALWAERTDIGWELVHSSDSTTPTIRPLAVVRRTNNERVGDARASTRTLARPR